jgi:hypothetical protein
LIPVIHYWRGYPMEINMIWFDICRLDATCFINLHQVCKRQLAASLISTALLQVDDVNTPAATCWQLAADRQNLQLAASLWSFWLCNMCI